jgi:hypothetical protein
MFSGGIFKGKVHEKLNQCCGSGMFIPEPRITDPDFYPCRISDLGSRIPDPKQQQKRGVKKIVATPFPFFCHKFHKIEELDNFLPKKLSLKNMGFGIRDTGFGIRTLFRIPDPEVKKAPLPGSGSAQLC